MSTHRREFRELADYWDGNWVHATITVAAGAFGGSYEALLRAEEFVEFRERLGSLRDALVGGAQFEPMEPWIHLRIAGDGRGHFHASCVAHDQLGVGSGLTFGIDFDQTELPAILRGLDEICDAFPVVGAPPTSVEGR